MKLILTENLIIGGTRVRADETVEVDDDLALYLMKANLAIVAGKQMPEPTATPIEEETISVPTDAFAPIPEAEDAEDEPPVKSSPRRTTKKATP